MILAQARLALMVRLWLPSPPNTFLSPSSKTGSRTFHCRKPRLLWEYARARHVAAGEIFVLLANDYALSGLQHLAIVLAWSRHIIGIIAEFFLAAEVIPLAGFDQLFVASINFVGARANHRGFGHVVAGAFRK